MNRCRPDAAPRPLRHGLRRGGLPGAATLLACAAAAAPPDAEDGPPPRLDRIVVTAQKKEQLALDVPISLTTLSGDRLERDGSSRLQDYAAQVPGMSLSSSRAGASQVVLRGITTGAAQSASTTAFYLDEAPIGSINAYAQGSSITPDIDPADLQRIEVLRGPQGTLYGANALGGLVRYLSIAPDTQRAGGRVALGVDTTRHGGTGTLWRLAANLPFDDQAMALRISLFQRVEAGFIDDAGGAADVNRAKVEGGRLAWLWKLAPGWSLTASALGQRTSADGTPVEDVLPGTLAPVEGDLRQRRYTAEPSRIALGVANATLRGTLGDYALVASTTWQESTSSQVSDYTARFGAALGRATGIGDLGIRSDNRIATRRWSQELRAGSAAFDGRLQWESGLFYTRESSSNRLPGFQPFSTTSGQPYTLPTIAQAAIDTRYEEYSVYGNANVAIAPRWDLMLGLRQSADHQRYAQDYRGLLVGPVPLQVTAASSESTTAWLLALSFKPTARTSLHARVANGHRPGGPNAVPPSTVASAPPSFQPDTLVSREIGFKSVSGDGAVSFEGALFDTRWSGVQIQTSAGGFNFLVNGAGATSRGIEAALVVMPTGTLALRASAAYTDARLDQDAPAAGGLAGDALPLVPRFTAFLGAEDRWPAAGGWTGFGGGGVSFVGRRRSDFSARVPSTLDAYATLDLHIGWESRGWRLSIQARNLGDARGFTSAAPRATTPGGPLAAGVIEPRTVGLEAAYRF